MLDHFPLLRLPALTAAALVALVVLAGCADTLQNQPLHDRDLEFVAVDMDFPIYWVGRAFEGYSVSSVSKDPNGAFSLAYGDCAVGGQGVCVTPLLIVSSPDNSFIPGTGPHHAAVIQGRRATVSDDGGTIALATGRVVVNVFGRTPAIAQAAARSMIPINMPERSDAQLPAPFRDTGYSRTPLEGFTTPFITPPAAGVSGNADVGGSAP